MREPRGQKGYIYWFIIFIVCIFCIIGLRIGYTNFFYQEVDHGITKNIVDIDKPVNAQLYLNDRFIKEAEKIISSENNIMVISNDENNDAPLSSITIQTTTINSAELYFSNKINILKDEKLILEKKEDIKKSNTVISRYYIDFTKGYWPSGGHSMYLYFVKKTDPNEFIVVEDIQFSVEELEKNKKRIVDFLTYVID